jgi:alpha-beta hydrolase superfamily lysophospholipase
MTSDLQILEDKPLAFSTADPSLSLVSASSRLHVPFETTDGTALLNVEVFNEEVKHGPILLCIHGVCSSAETLGIQALVSDAKKSNIRVAVLECEGHGYSSGKPGVCPDFDRLVRHACEFVSHVVSVFDQKSKEDVAFALCGNSMGGVLSIYAAEEISKAKSKSASDPDYLPFPGQFIGVAPICPAVGVDPSAVPGCMVVQALTYLALIAPAATVPLTPLEDPTHYNCPPDTKRNYSGHWPLGTSKMLLDVTSTRVPKDLSNNASFLSGVASMLVITGEVDEIIPCEAVTTFYERVVPQKKRIITIPHAGHDLMCFMPSSKIATSEIFAWMISSSELIK